MMILSISVATNLTMNIAIPVRALDMVEVVRQGARKTSALF